MTIKEKMYCKSLWIQLLLVSVISVIVYNPFVPAEEICEVDRPSVVERVINRSYPSVFAAIEHVIFNKPPPDSEWDWSYHKEMLSHVDLYWQLSFRGLRFQMFTPKGPKIVAGDVDHVQYEKSQIQSLNPDFLFLAAFPYYGTHPSDYYPEDWQYWLRDEDGNRIQDTSWQELLIDYTLPGAEDHFVEMAIAVAECGIFDGIFMDLWSERVEAAPGPGGIAHLYHGNRVEALVSLVKRIREAVGDDFLIIVNTRTEKIPRSAPYVNGAFIETWDAAYPRERILEIENALSWYEANFRYPQVNCLDIAKSPSEPWDSPANQQLVRTFTTLGLTHSNGYILINGKPHYGGHFWYPFFDAPLGRPIGAKGETYENRDGLFIREFTNGWAVYNRSGKEQEIEFPQEVSSWNSGVKGNLHTLADLDGEIYLKAEAPPTADVNGDGVVNIQDLVIVANAFGEAAPDLNGDGVVNIQDLVIVANAF